MKAELVYPGKELDIFEKAKNWREYIRSQIGDHIRGRVLEVGAGIGSMTMTLRNPHSSRWVLVEPDPAMSGLLEQKIRAGGMPANSTLVRGTIALLDEQNGFDTILYIDVLEHIEDDSGELDRAMNLLAPGGRIIILAPAFSFLISPFDKAIGHVRRYSRSDLRKVIPGGLHETKLRYLDTGGFMASLANKVLLRQSYPSERQIRFWDNTLVSFSRMADKLFGYSFGKSILGIWTKT